MKIAFIVFDGITWLDLVGLYDPISRLKHMNFLPSLTWDFCSYTPTVQDHYGMRFEPTNLQSSLSGYDVLAVPGGYGTRALQGDKSFINWLQTGAAIPQKISVCTGSLLLGAAGFLTGRKATTHFSEYDTLRPFCREVIEERIVEDKDIITAGAVTASIDLGLYLCRKWVSEEAAHVIKKKMAYGE